ncbi:GNAT family N-acetyltransferase [Treponema denticola]|uniref:GNAT family N-acetyltransferase n=1 Tax=Treponema denticola TaxID=158 RepID=UPI0002B51DE6|nr:GNAT family N-acetyltransferase [Treponema denticola]EMB45771.1 hypothetical protein HMPREF9730_00897 [Treponema denticola AL-2]
MPDWIKYRIPKKLLDNKNKNIKIEEFSESENKDIIPQIYADAFCDKAWESDWYKIDLFNPASCFIAKYNEEYAGFIISFIKENSAYISVIAVLKKYQKCGIGISLINRVINYFKNQDLEIYLDVESKNKTAINWYNKRGFIQIIESTTLCTNKKHGIKNENKRY